jgi:hypothetical protein
MKFLVTTFVFLLGICLASETTIEITLNQVFKLERGTSKPSVGTYPQGKWQVDFLHVSNDSRCPLIAQCVWAGDAQLEFQITRGKTSKRIILHTGLQPKAVKAFGYVLAVKRLEPDVEAAKVEGKYSVELLLTKP